MKIKATERPLPDWLAAELWNDKRQAEFDQMFDESLRVPARPKGQTKKGGSK